MNLKRYLIPTGYWTSLLFAAIWLGAYLVEGQLSHITLAIALLALSLSLRALGIATALGHHR